MTLVDHPRLLVALAMVNVPVYAAIWRTFFGDWARLLDDLRLLATPDLLDLIRDELWADRVASFRMGWFAGICGLTVVSEYVTLLRHAPGVLGWFEGWLA